MVVQMERRPRPASPTAKSCVRRELTTGQLRLVQLKLGPEPASSLEAMIGYGLDDTDLAIYYGVTVSTIRRLKHFFGLG